MESKNALDTTLTRMENKAEKLQAELETLQTKMQTLLQALNID